MGPSDPREKGITLQSPADAAQNMVNELQPKTDVIILLSHLGYQKDMELAQKVKGIHIIVGGHTGMTIQSPSLVNNTVILQTGSQGKSAAKIEFLFYDNEFNFRDSKRKMQLENELSQYTQQLKEKRLSKARRAELNRMKKDAGQALDQLGSKNYFNNSFVPLQENIKEDPEIKRMVDDYKAKAQAAGPSAPPKLSPTGQSRDISIKIPSYAEASEGYPPVAKSAAATRLNNTE